MLRVVWRLLAVALLAAACGDATPASTTVTNAETTLAPSTTPQPQATSEAPSTTTSTTATTTTATTAPSTTTLPPASTVEPLSSYRFLISVAVVANPGDAPGEPIHELSGEFASAPMAMRIFGEFRDEQIDLVTDGSRWWDLDDVDLEISDDDIRFFLGGNGFLLVEWIEELLDNDMAWEFLRTEDLDVATRRSRRVNIVGGVDWEFGDLAQLDVWRDDLGQVAKLQAWFATGDNSGFPVSTWEITKRNPQLTIQLPSG